jgi:ubiquinone/menaquinone biosynthesis C-methylase UbiE
VTDQQARYDRIAEGYAAHWAPIHRPATLRMLGLLDDLDEDPRSLLDVGCGTGVFAAACVDRWPGAEVEGTDISAGMLEVAERARAALGDRGRDRLRLRQAPADRLPYPDGMFDVVTSAFVLQLVPSRHRALREMRRVLRPGGRLAIVTWLQGGSPFAADAVYDEALLDAGLEPRPSGGECHDPRSPAATEAVLRRAGFSAPRAHADDLRHQFTPESYLAFVTRFDDADLFEDVDPDQRAALEADLLRRLRALGPDDLQLVLPIVLATAIRR